MKVIIRRVDWIFPWVVASWCIVSVSLLLLFLLRPLFLTITVDAVGSML